MASEDWGEFKHSVFVGSAAVATVFWGYISAWSWVVVRVVAGPGFGVTLLLVVANGVEETRDVVGAVKNEPSSNVSRKSL